MRAKLRSDAGRSRLRMVWRMVVVVAVLVGNSSAFFIKWPWSFYPGATTTTTTTAAVAGSINYGFLRPAIVVQLPPTTAAPTTTTTTTTTPRSQVFINALLGSSLPLNNNSLLISLANALANRPVIGGLAQPYPQVVAGGGVGGVALPLPPQVVGGVGGVALPPQIIGGGVAAGAGGGIILPSGFPATGGVASAGIIPGLFPGILGRSAKETVEAGQLGRVKPGGSGRVVFGSRKRK